MKKNSSVALAKFVLAGTVVLLADAVAAVDVGNDKSGCTQNLKNIHGAIQNYREAHKDLPGRLSDMMPEYLSDRTVLSCPVARSRGINSYQVAGWAEDEWFDPKTTYIYEFGSNAIPSAVRGGYGRSMRVWKRAQMGLVGGRIPMVRCLVHGRALNLGFDGQIYDSERNWEREFSDVVPTSELAPVRRLSGGEPVRVVPVPPRQGDTPARLIDLDDFYNASLVRSWSTSTVEPGCHLGDLPSGRQTLSGTPFDIRGLIQIRCDSFLSAVFPVSVTNIPIRLRCARIHFLHAAAWDQNSRLVHTNGYYRIHFDGGRVEEVPTVYGRHLLEWRTNPGGKLSLDANSVVAWSGHYTSSTGERKAAHLYRTTWTNPAPDTLVRSLDLVAALDGDGVPRAKTAPFLVAVTAEP